MSDKRIDEFRVCILFLVQYHIYFHCTMVGDVSGLHPDVNYLHPEGVGNANAPVRGLCTEGERDPVGLRRDKLCLRHWVLIQRHINRNLISGHEGRV